MAFYSILPSSSLRVTGGDRFNFVQGRVSADLRAAEGGLTGACFLNARGQVEQFMRIYPRENDIYLHGWAGEAAPLAAELRRHVFFEDVQIHDTSDILCTLHLWQPLPELEGEGLAWHLPSPKGTRRLVGKVARSPKDGRDVHLLGEELHDFISFLQEKGLAERPVEELMHARISAGLPEPSRDRWKESYPQEIGLGEAGPLPSVSYRKGCYLGQETMARLEASRGPRHALALLEGSGVLPSFAEVKDGTGKVIGQLGESGGRRALARLSRRADVEALHAGEIAVRVVGQWPPEEHR